MGGSSKNQTWVTRLFLLYLETRSVTLKTASSAVPDDDEDGDMDQSRSQLMQDGECGQEMTCGVVCHHRVASPPPDGAGYQCACRKVWVVAQAEC